MYLSRVSIQGFKGYEEAQVVDLSPHFNVIVGESDKGKSSFLHAIRWVVRNLPSGTRCINVQSDSATVSLGLSDGHVVTRYRNKNGGPEGNTYTLQDRHRNSMYFEAIGKDVPDEIRKVFGMDPLMLQGKQLLDLNFGLQHDPLFLVFSSDSTLRAKILGILTGAEIVDVAITIINRIVENFRSERRVVEQRKAQLLKDVRELIDPDPLVGMLKTVKEKRKKLMEVGRRIALVEDYIYLSDTAQKEKAAYQRIHGIREYLALLQSKLEANLREMGSIEKAVEASCEASVSVARVKKQYTSSMVMTRIARRRLEEFMSKTDLCPYSRQEMPRECKDALQEVCV